MRRKSILRLGSALLLFTWLGLLGNAAERKQQKAEFQTSDRCLACHNGLTASSGKDVSIGFDWRASVMANSARDPYWLASVRREDLDHPGQKAEIEDGCADCHMPIARYEAKEQGHLGQVFEHIPFDRDPKKNAGAADGISCSVCHQISRKNLGTKESFNGGFLVDPPETPNDRPEYGPFLLQSGHARVMQTSTGGYRPTTAAHIRDSAMCATCHTLYTKSLSRDGKVLGQFPEQMPYQEWLHSAYPQKATCQACHMPEVPGEVPISAVLGAPRTGVHQHTFVGGNFFFLRLLNLHGSDLGASALPIELNSAADQTIQFLQSQAARVTIRDVEVSASHLRADIFVENLSGHKLPTAFPSRRAWLHFVVRDHEGRTLFESGTLNRDGSIQGNDNDLDAQQYEPHYREIMNSDEVEIYEPILKDDAGHVTTGLAAAAGYLKDNRLLPAGFQKQTADQDVAVIGDAAEDPNFNDSGDLVRYSVALANGQGPYEVEVELWYQPIGFRWAHNLAAYRSSETERFLNYYDSNAALTAVVLAHARVIR